MNKLILAVLVIFVLDIHCFALAKSLRTLEDALATTKMNMYCASHGENPKNYDIIKDGVIESIFNNPPSNQVQESDDYVDCYYEIPSKGKPTITIKVEQFPTPEKNKNMTIMPFAGNPNSYLEENIYKGNFSVDFVCYNPGQTIAKMSLSMKIENGGNVDFAVYFSKTCGSYPLEKQYIYMKKKADTNLISNQGFIHPNFHPYNDELFVDDLGSVTYIILSGEYTQLLDCILTDDNDESITIQNDEPNGDEKIDDQRVLEIIFSGEAKRYKVTIQCSVVYSSYSQITFSFIKDYKEGPLPGFDVLVDSSYIVSQYAVINDGIVTPPFSGNDRNGVTVGSNKQCLILHFRSRYGITNYTVPVVKGAGVETTIMGQASESRSVGKESQKFIICHQCNELGINHVRVSFDVIYAERKTVNALPKLVFEYDKDCASSSKIPITITPGIYTPTVASTYAVKKGVVSPGYLPGVHLVKARWDEERTRFYIENEGDRELKISYPSVNIDVGVDSIDPKVSVIGYDEEDEIVISKDSGAKIMEIDYNCNREGEFHIMVEIVVEETPITISWLKICKSYPYSYSVGTYNNEGSWYNGYSDDDYYNDDDEYKGNYENNNNPEESSNYANDVIANGRVRNEYSSDNTFASINYFLDEQTYYFHAGGESKLEIIEKPHVKSSNKKICEVKESGSIFDSTELTKDTRQLDLNFKCKKQGSARIDVVFTIGKRGKTNSPTTFSVMKICNPDSVNLNFLKDVIILVACVSIVFLLYPYVLACFPDTRWLRPWSYFRSYTRIPSKEN